ncbi:MAG: amidase family protein [Propionibacteriaceae bacterium]|nr:amidase family protein [Propionibacteriaceae bacterium]
MNDQLIPTMSATEISRRVRSRQLRATDVVASCLERIGRSDTALRAFTAVRDSAALAEAEALDAGGPGSDGPLAGVPVAVKEEYDVQGMVTTLGGHGNSTPAGADSEAIRRLRAAGAIIVGKTTMPEFGQFPETASLRHGISVNPWNEDYSPGGSSGGSAAAVAAGLVPVALGADGGGSIRIPASCCGLIGLKPERGRISPAPASEHWYGLVSLGALSRTVADTALVCDVLAGTMPTDRWRPTPLPRPLAEDVAAGPGRLRICWTLAPVLPGLETDPEVSAALTSMVGRLSGLGHQVEQTTRRWPVPTDSFLIQFLAGMYAESTMVEHRGRLEPRTRRTASLGRFVPAGLLRAALRRGRSIADAIDQRFLSGWDVLMLPTLPRLVPRAGYLNGLGTVRSLLASTPYVANTAIFNVSGHPALSIPGGLSRAGLPIGVQLVARPGREGTLLALAAQLETEQPWPPLPLR